MKRFRALSRRGAAARPTGDHVCSSLPTLTASSYGTSGNGNPGDGRSEYKHKGKPSLQTMVRRAHREAGPTLTRAAFGPTLLASDAERGYLRRAAELRETRGRGPRMAELFSGALSPTWCEQYMGFPIGWTESEPSGTR